MYKLFVFDLGNVIIPFDHTTIAPRLLKYSKKKDAFKPEDIHRFFYRGEELEHKYEEGKIGTTEFISNVRERFSLDISNEEFTSIFCDIFFSVSREVEEILMGLKKSKRRLVLLSNTNEMHFEHIMKRYEIMSIFDYYILSYRIGCRKPDRRIYEHLIEYAKCNPEEIFYTDDMIDYIEAAKRLGISAHHFKDSESIYPVLKDYLI